MRDIIKKQQAVIDELESKLRTEMRIDDHLEKTLDLYENALLYKDDLLDKAYRKIGELVVSGE